MWQNIKLTTKLYIGFAAVLSLLGILATVSVSGIGTVKEIFTEYRQTARVSLALGSFKDRLMEARLSALKHRSNDSDQNKNAVDEKIKQMVAEIVAFGKITQVDKMKEDLEGYKQKLAEYEKAFHQTVKLQKKRHNHVAILSETGPKTRKQISKLVESAYRDGDVEAAYLGGLVNESLMLGRFFAERFLLKNTEESYKRASKELDITQSRIDTLLKSLENPNRRETARKAKANVNKYSATLAKIKEDYS